MHSTTASKEAKQDLMHSSPSISAEKYQSSNWLVKIQKLTANNYDN